MDCVVGKNAGSLARIVAIRLQNAFSLNDAVELDAEYRFSLLPHPVAGLGWRPGCRRRRFRELSLPLEGLPLPLEGCRHPSKSYRWPLGER